MRRALLELGLLVFLMLLVGTVYAVWNSRNPKRGIPWVSRLLPEGIRCPKARTGDAGSERGAPEKFRFIDHEETWERYQARDAIFIDARRTNEYERGHIRGAISIPFWEEETARERMLRFREETPLDHPVVLYCTRASDCEDSQELAAALYNLGFRDLMVYDGGFPEWEEKAKDAKKVDELVATGSEPGER